MPDNSQIQTISLEDFDSLFQDSPSPAPAPAPKPVEGVIPTKQPMIVGQSNEIPIVNLDELEKEIKPVSATTINTEENKPVETDEEPETPTEVKEVLKNTVGYMIEQGLWADFDGREEMEFDNDTYAALAMEQNQRQINNTVNEILDSTGVYGKAIINHIKQGGNPDEVIDIFKEHKRIESLGNIDTPEAKKQYVIEYYKNFANWSDSKAEKMVDRLIEDDGLDAEVEDVKENYKTIHEKQLEEIENQQKEIEQAQEKKKEETKENLTRAIETDEDLTKEEKIMLKKSLFKFNRKLEDGTVVNDFLYKFNSFQTDPKKYAKLVHFIVDTENYEKKLQQKAGAEVKKNQWNFIKDNAAVNRKLNTATPDVRQPQTSYTGTNFKFK